MSTTGSAGAAALEPPGRLDSVVRVVGAYVALTKPRIIELLLLTTLPTMVIAARGLPSVRLMVTTLVGGALAAGGANALNMVYDRDIDAVMSRTKRRPLVTGAVTPAAAVVFALILEAGAFAELWGTANLLAAVLALSATAFYVAVYTAWLKRASPQNIVIGGAAGAMPVLVGWAAVTGRLGLVPLVLFAIIFLWTPPHFWALAVRYRGDYAAAGIPMLPAVADLPTVASRILAYTVVLWVVSLVVAPLAHLGWPYVVVALAMGAVFVHRAWGLRSDPSPKRAMSLFTYSISYLSVLFIAMGADVLLVHP
jgi:protoheme IX farnesyltransferase